MVSSVTFPAIHAGPSALTERGCLRYSAAMAKQKTPLNRTPERPRLRLEYRDLGEIVRWPRNPKKHDVGAINASTTRFGFRDPIAVNDETHELEVGHGRLDSLQASKAAGQPAPAFIDVDENGRWLVPVLVFQDSRAIQEAYAIAHNRTMELGGGWETEQLAAILADLAAQDGLAGVGYDGDDLDAMLRSLTDDGGAAILPSAEQAEADKQAVAAATRTLAERFGVPPFSVLDQRQGYWQERKRAWLALGIRSEVGRLQNALGLSEEAILSTQLGPCRSPLQRCKTHRRQNERADATDGRRA